MPACIRAAASLFWGGVDAHALIHQITTKVWALFGLNLGDFLFLVKEHRVSQFLPNILLLNPNKNVKCTGVQMAVCWLAQLLGNMSDPLMYLSWCSGFFFVLKWTFSTVGSFIDHKLSKDKYTSCVCWYTLHLSCLTWTLNYIYALFAASICGLSTGRSTPTAAWRTSREGSGNSSEEAAELSGLVTREHRRS